MKVKGLVLKIVSLVATVLAFLGLAFKFAVMTVSAGSYSDSKALTRKEWIDTFKMKDYLKDYAAGINFWQIARVFMIISLIVIAVLAVITIVQFFFNHKYLSLAKKIVSIVGIVCVVVFIATLVIGSIMVASKMSGNGATYMFLPNVGSCFIFIFGLVASITALLDKKNA